jgi:hypothetical protein
MRTVAHGFWIAGYKSGLSISTAMSPLQHLPFKPRARHKAATRRAITPAC